LGRGSKQQKETDATGLQRPSTAGSKKRETSGKGGVIRNNLQKTVWGRSKSHQIAGGVPIDQGKRKKKQRRGENERKKLFRGG